MGSIQTVDVASNFSDTDALTFVAASGDMGIATVEVSGSVVTITPVAEGMATITVTATDLADQTATQTFTVSVFPVITGTNEVEKINVSVFPNPIKDRVKITVDGGGAYRLLETSGKTLTSGTLTKGDNNVALPSLIEGIYLLKIQTKLGSTTRKVVKK